MAPVTFLRALPRLAFSSRLSLVAAASLPRVAINSTTFARTLAAAATKKTTATSATAKAAPKKVAVVKKAAATKKKAPAAKKPVKKVAAKKPAAKKAAPKKAGRVTKKVLTEEEKKAKLFERKVKAYKLAALGKAPSKGALSTYNIYVKQQTGTTSGRLDLASLSQRYKSLTIQEVQNLAKEQEKANAERLVAYKKWVEGFTPSQIEAANTARRWLKRNQVKRVDLKPIEDARRVTHPRSAYMYFAQETMKGLDIAIGDRGREAGRQWKALSDEDKAVYQQLAQNDKDRYKKERAQAGFV